ncbi:PREDICTED: uncharacterized protein LOC104605112 [Nelumbo nucifera]|uniref:Uncharacterized protein LOC104605112 n=1 Tax=Nelumbo nucifera TaxID=4432 RepID=A0A1U8AXI8_NELNU|nr:PREDICTED: uncharacterized protein LOC104605112 [Nelumbo nucifera]
MDGLGFKAGIHVFSTPISAGGGIDGRAHLGHVSALGRSGGGSSTNTNAISVDNSPATTSAPQKTSSSRFSFTYPLRFMWPGGGKANQSISLYDDIVVLGDGTEGGGQGDSIPVEVPEIEPVRSRERRGNWVLKILHVRSLWSEQGKRVVGEMEPEEQKENDLVNCSGRECSCCRACDDEESGSREEDAQFDRDSFSRLLRRVSLAEAKLYAQMSYLGNLAYSIPKIKPGNLLKYHGLRFVTSSIKKKEQTTNSAKEQNLSEVKETEKKPEEAKEGEEERKDRRQISASAAYQIAASAASYLHSQTRSIIPFKSSKADTGEDSLDGHKETGDNVNIMSSEVASLVATTNSVTAVVAAKEEMKQAVVKDLNSAHSSPCEWFICDNDQSGTRFFVIQGSESLASWQANLLFEPVQFEGLDVLVHRGIYEAAKGIYEQMLPEVRAHLKSRGDSAKLRFTGHSLGGSLSLLVNLMLLIRKEVPPSSLLPVVTFGSPYIMCGGDQLLHKLGLPQSHVKAITMHRDIVPRAFSCSYPDHVAELLKAVNANFRNHPCLNNQKLLYAPMGELLILQPDENLSPHHQLLPSGSGLYLLKCPGSGSLDAEKQLRAAQRVFFNSPHPLEILSDRSAYGSDGTVYRDHDMNSYLRSVRGVLRQEHKRIRKAKRERRRHRMWWPLVAPHGVHADTVVSRDVVSNNMGQQQVSFSGVLRTGRDSLKRFSRLVASQHMHFLVLFLLPARLLLLGTFAVVNLG